METCILTCFVVVKKENKRTNIKKYKLDKLIKKDVTKVPDTESSKTQRNNLKRLEKA